MRRLFDYVGNCCGLPSEDLVGMFMYFSSPRVTLWTPKIGPKWNPNRIFDAEPLRNPLGSLLERSWMLLEPKKRSSDQLLAAPRSPGTPGKVQNVQNMQFFSRPLNEHLPPDDISDQPETWPKCVSDEPQYFIFRLFQFLVMT